MSAERLRLLHKTLEDTKPSKLSGLSREILQSYSDKLSDILPYLSDQQLVIPCRDRIELLKRELELRRIEEREDYRHREVFGVGRKTLFWARLAVLAAVVVPVVLALISQFPLSKLLHARTDKASQPTYRQTPEPTAASSESEASSSSATPSLGQTATAQPSASPPESSDNFGD